ncbi:alpha/beta hydrolase family protein [Chitinophaga nivalis]|uniref:Alpha/beta hydrolase n=1 Tax=Chitinophaga nivalis TaxID=2991709 RepID=A0ABT3IUR6_9BACT|nr:alpha/beta hydrolase [Chitinophaga nivalis]MCW3462683.1 alpha/beta hydrolase [Chitinophaga nivalis]MCW3487626.1 alpha/beta hydrolase [Chitinophaga nivalis]
MHRISLLVMISCLCSCLLFTNQGYAQQLAGDWHGNVAFLPIQLHITWDSTAHRYKTTMDSPKQQAFGLPFNSFQVTDDSITAGISTIQATLSARIISPDSISGKWQQGNNRVLLSLRRSTLSITLPPRPQEPLLPLPYRSEDVTYTNTDKSITYSGTLTTPLKGGPFPAVLLISGSGPQNRNSEFYGHKPFLVLSDYLTRQGIAVLRVDDRGTAQTTGIYATATVTDFAVDARTNIAYLRSRKDLINPSSIGIIGHSEGGIIGPMVAAGNKDIAFLVMLAGPGAKGKDVLIAQNKALFQQSGADTSALKTYLTLYGKLVDLCLEQDTTGLYVKANKLVQQWETAQSSAVKAQFGITPANVGQQTQTFIRFMCKPEFKSILAYDPQPFLRNIQCPVLALNGSKDLQVVPDFNLAGIAKICRDNGNKKVTTRELPGLNHLFQTASTGAPAEYSQISETFSPIAMELIGSWIKQQVSR